MVEKELVPVGTIVPAILGEGTAVIGIVCTIGAESVCTV